MKRTDLERREAAERLLELHIARRNSGSREVILKALVFFFQHSETDGGLSLQFADVAEYLGGRERNAIEDAGSAEEIARRLGVLLGGLPGFDCHAFALRFIQARDAAEDVKPALWPMTSPRFRVIPPSDKYNGTAATNWEVFAMLSDHSIFAHKILSGSFADVCEFARDMGEQFKTY